MKILVATNKNGKLLMLEDWVEEVKDLLHYKLMSYFIFFFKFECLFLLLLTVEIDKSVKVLPLPKEFHILDNSNMH